MVSGWRFGALIVDIVVPKSTWETLSQSCALEADFVHLGVGFDVCKNIVPTYDNIQR